MTRHPLFQRLHMYSEDPGTGSAGTPESVSRSSAVPPQPTATRSAVAALSASFCQS
ncbi:hypothetical protein FKP32DRAFT_1592813 [Trametes sanguinea]|nr:hypothetical protein FKP32DRAFT_1592813 [Trametes sanguinea]